MKTNMNLIRAAKHAFKKALYAFQVIIIALAIPLLSFIELSHKDAKDQNISDKNNTRIVTDKSEVVAYNVTIKQIKK
ncbi:MAG: hypothetical protein ABIO55_01610 [Ginsengibacter sp.]